VHLTAEGLVVGYLRCLAQGAVDDTVQVAEHRFFKRVLVGEGGIIAGQAVESKASDVVYQFLTR